MAPSTEDMAMKFALTYSVHSVYDDHIHADVYVAMDSIGRWLHSGVFTKKESADAFLEDYLEHLPARLKALKAK